jgi:hypothetical protein
VDRAEFLGLTIQCRGDARLHLSQGVVVVP